MDMIEELEQAFKIGGNLEDCINKHKCEIIFDDVDDDINRITDIKDDNGNKYHFLNGIYDDSWWD